MSCSLRLVDYRSWTESNLNLEVGQRASSWEDLQLLLSTYYLWYVTSETNGRFYAYLLCTDRKRFKYMPFIHNQNLLQSKSPNFVLQLYTVIEPQKGLREFPPTASLVNTLLSFFHVVRVFLSLTNIIFTIIQGNLFARYQIISPSDIQQPRLWLISLHLTTSCFHEMLWIFQHNESHEPNC